MRAKAVVDRVQHLEPERGAEIGVAGGETSEILLRHLPDLKLYMVDNYLSEAEQPQRYRETGDYHSKLVPSHQASLAATARERTDFAAQRRLILGMSSKEASELIAGYALDFVFIDADHSYEGCSEDINLWLPKIRPGGILCGHDYPQIPMVVEAVDDFIADSSFELELGPGNTWFVQV